MNDFITVILQSALGIALFYAVYHLFLRKDTFFKTNRIYLLTALVLSAVLPLIRFDFLLARTDPVLLVFLDPVVITPEGVISSMEANTSLFRVLLTIYLTGAGIFSIRFLYQLGQLLFLVRKYGITRRAGVRIVFTDKHYAPFSFFNLVFMGNKEFEKGESHKIIAHERVHIRQWHSLDLILLEIITIIQWFNPFIWAYRHAIKTLHEYLADEGVIHSGVDVKVYRALLFRQSTGIQINDLTNNFSKSLLKRRFTMMTKKRTNQLGRLKIMLVLPVALSMMLLFSFSPDMLAQQENEVPPPPPKASERSAKQTNPPPPPPAPGGEKYIQKAEPQEQEKPPIFTVVEEMPEFPGGRDALINHIVENIKYPEEAKKNKLTGTVYVTFVVEKDGKVSNVKVLRGVAESLDKEALRVVAEMPDWKPGRQDGKAVRVQYTLPINFSLDNDKEEKKE